MIVLLSYTYYHGIIDHSGINFKAYWWQPWQPNCIFHDNHHQYFHVNFGFNIKYWDTVSSFYIIQPLRDSSGCYWNIHVGHLLVARNGPEERSTLSRGHFLRPRKVGGRRHRGRIGTRYGRTWIRESISLRQQSTRIRIETIRFENKQEKQIVRFPFYVFRFNKNNAQTMSHG